MQAVRGVRIIQLQQMVGGRGPIISYRTEEGPRLANSSPNAITGASSNCIFPAPVQHGGSLIREHSATIDERGVLWQP